MRTSKKIVSLVLAVMMVVSMMAVMAVSANAADFSTDTKAVFVTDSQNWDGDGALQAYYWKVVTTGYDSQWNPITETVPGEWVEMTYLFDNNMNQSVYGVVIPDDATWVLFNRDNTRQTTDTKNVYSGSWWYIDNNKVCQPCSGDVFDTYDQTDSLSTAFVTNTGADRYFVLDGKYYYIDDNDELQQYTETSDLLVAQVVGGDKDGQTFTSVNDAIAAAGEGGEVKLIADITGNVGIDGDYTTTLNLNSHNITNNSGSAITLYTSSNGKTFTIKGTGKVTCTPKYAGDACISDSSGRNVVIKGGTYTNTVEGKNALYVSSDEGWTISGGTFNGNIMVKSDFTVTGGTVNGNIVQSTKTDYSSYPFAEVPADITVTGGTVNGEIVENDANNGNIVVTGGTFTGDVSEYVDATTAKVKYTATNGKVTYKTNIDYSNMSSSGTYQLLGDLTANSRIVPGLFASNVTIDLNGYTLTSTATDEAFLFSRAGSAANHNTYTIKNGTVVAAGDGVDLLANYADLTLEDVEIVANGTYGVVTNGTNTGNNITATDSSITAGELGIYKPSNGSLTLTDTDVTGKTAVYVKSGDVTINGGTFTGTGDAADYKFNGNGAEITGDAVVIDNCGYPGGAPTATIVDGTFVSTNADAVASYVKQDDPTQTGSFEQVDGIVEGGTYSSDVTELCAPGLVAEESGAEFSIVPFTTDGKADIKGYQNKAVQASAEGNGVRILTQVDKDWLEANASDYGYVVAKVSGKEQASANFANLKANGGNGEKTISCKGTYNNGIDGVDNTYVTLAVNGMSDGNQAAARFYVVVNGVTYYGNYVNLQSKTFGGIIATYNA